MHLLQIVLFFCSLAYFVKITFLEVEQKVKKGSKKKQYFTVCYILVGL